MEMEAESIADLLAKIESWYEIEDARNDNEEWI